MRQLYIILIFITSLTFSGCSVVNEYEDSFKFKYLHSTSVTAFDEVVEELLLQLCPTIKELSTEHEKPFYVVDFVNLQDLENHSELGFMLSDELKTLVTQKCNRAVYSIEYTKYLKIGANGTKLLSRDIDELNRTKINRNTYALVGTYAMTQRQLILYLKLVDLRTGIIHKAATQKTTLTDEIIHFEKKPRQSRLNSNTIYEPMSL